ncbi:MAG: DUF3656 domain-containing protein, partial [Verrucomicrobiota bacterium]
LEMAFSRGLYSGWMHGVNHQALVAGRFGKKRGPLVGEILRVGADFVEMEPKIFLKLGDGLVFDTGGDTDDEQGGRIFGVKGGRYFFQHGRIDFRRLKKGDKVWKTDDPELNKRLRQSFGGKIEGRRRAAVDLVVRGCAGEKMRVTGVVRGEAGLTEGETVVSGMSLAEARTAPLTTEKLGEHLGRWGESGYAMGLLTNELEGGVILPISEMNRMRRELVFQLDEARKIVRVESGESWRDVFAEARGRGLEQRKRPATLRVLCRSIEQLSGALASGVEEIYADFEDIRRYKDAVVQVRDSGRGVKIFLATPRIQKAGEEGFFKLIERSQPDGVLIRNLGAIRYFEASPLRKVGDFSLNVANPLTAKYLMESGMERVTVSYDLNIEQVLDLLEEAPPEWFELTIHQHMPMFHMEHCVFAAFLSKGKDATDCGRPCEKHRVELRDRVGVAHPLRADVGCRNTVFNAVPQTGARFFQRLEEAGLRDFRIELLGESEEEAVRVIGAYRALLGGESGGEDLWRELRAESQLGVTHGTYGRD